MPAEATTCPFCQSSVAAGACVCKECHAEYGYGIHGDTRVAHGVDGLKAAHVTANKLAKWMYIPGLLIAINSCIGYAARDVNNHHDSSGTGIAIGVGLIFFGLCTKALAVFSFYAVRSKGEKWFRGSN